MKKFLYTLLLCICVSSIFAETAEKLVQKGILKGKKGKIEDAMACFNKAIEVDSTYPEAYFNRGYAKNMLDDNKASIADFTKAIQYDSTYSNAYFNRALAYAEDKDNRAAIKDFTTVIKLDSGTNAEAYYFRGVSRYFLVQLDSAIADFDSAVVVDSTYAEAYYNKALVKTRLGGMDNLKEALSLYSKAIGINPYDADFYNNRGQVRYVLKDYKGAVGDYNRALALAPDMARTYCNRGNAFFYMNDKIGACENWTTAVDMGFTLAQQMLDIYCQAPK